jgi:hypothetical protein
VNIVRADLTAADPNVDGAAVSSTTTRPRSGGRSSASAGQHPSHTKRWVLVAAGVIAAIVLGLVLLHAIDSQPRPAADSRYLAATQPHFPAVKESVLISLGHQVCATFVKNQDDPTKAEYEIASVASQYKNLPAADMVVLIKAAVQEYCPSFAGVLAATTTTTNG